MRFDNLEKAIIKTIPMVVGSVFGNWGICIGFIIGGQTFGMSDAYFSIGVISSLSALFFLMSCIWVYYDFIRDSKERIMNKLLEEPDQYNNIRQKLANNLKIPFKYIK